MTNIHPKFDALVQRLVYKIKNSQTPVPGFVVGLSGTDSIVAFILCYKALEYVGSDNLIGIHFRNKINRGWIENQIFPWLEENYPKAGYDAEYKENFNKDEYRWAALHERAKHFECWTVGTMNATEKALGTYSLLSTAVSIQPIQTLYKSTIIEICEALGVPRIAIENSRIPDCLCGRDDFAAQNIELIDKLLRFDDTSGYPDGRIEQGIAYIKACRNENGFRERVPYVI